MYLYHLCISYCMGRCSIISSYPSFSQIVYRIINNMHSLETTGTKSSMGGDTNSNTNSIKHRNLHINH